MKDKKSYWLIAACLMIASCSGEVDQSQESETEIDSIELEEIRIDSTILPEAFVGEPAASFEMEWGGEMMTFQLSAVFDDGENTPPLVMTLYTGEVLRAELPSHPAGSWWLTPPLDGKVPVIVEDFNQDGLSDLLITIEAITGIGPEGAIPFGVPSIYFQTKDASFQNFEEIDAELNPEMSMDEMVQLCADFNPNN